MKYLIKLFINVVPNTAMTASLDDDSYLVLMRNTFWLIECTVNVQEHRVTTQNSDSNTCITIRNDAISPPPYNTVLLVKYSVKATMLLTEF